MNRRIVAPCALALGCLLAAPSVAPAAPRRAIRDQGLLEMWREKPSIPRCVTHRAYQIPGDRWVGEVEMDGRLLFQLIDPAGDFTVKQRAELVARRLERLFELKGLLEPVKVERWANDWVVTMGGSLVVTAAEGTALRYRMSRRELAERWADSLRTTLHNALGPGAQVLRGEPPVQKIHPNPPPWDDRYVWLLKGDKAFGRKEYAFAAACYRKSLAEDPAAFDAHYCLGRALGRQGFLEEAKAEFVAALQLEPDYLPAQQGLAVIDRLQRRGFVPPATAAPSAPPPKAEVKKRVLKKVGMPDPISPPSSLSSSSSLSASAPVPPPTPRVEVESSPSVPDTTAAAAAGLTTEEDFLER